MASNFPGPYEVEIHYTSNSNQHVQRVNCDVLSTPAPGAAPSTIDLKVRGGGSVQLDTAVDDWVALLADNFEVPSSFDNFTFWKIDPGTFDKTFITTAALSQVGTGGGATTPEHQVALTFRTIEGGSMRIVMLESQTTTNERKAYIDSSVPIQAIMDFVVSTSDWILARDTSYPIASLNSVGGQNEALFKKAYR